MSLLALNETVEADCSKCGEHLVSLFEVDLKLAALSASVRAFVASERAAMMRLTLDNHAKVCSGPKHEVALSRRVLVRT